MQKQTCPQIHLKQHEFHDVNTIEQCCKDLERGFLQEHNCDENALVETQDGRSQTQLLNFRRKYECSVCGKRFLKPSLLQRHAVVHTSGKPFQCTICSKCFTQKSSLQRHIQHNHMGEKPHKCSECDKCFSQKTNLLMHLQRVHPLNSSASLSSEHRFACDRCRCVYSKLNSLNRHKSQYHRAVESESARIAQLAVTYQDETPVVDADELARSVLVELKKLQGVMMSSMQPTVEEQHENVNPRSISHNETPTTETLIATPETIMDAGKVNLVDVCDKLNPQLEPHSITVQCIRRSDGFANYVCEFCAKEFRKTYDLLRHRRTHLQETPYKCVQCSRWCITKSKLEEHKKVHTSTHASLPCNQYICSICHQVFDSIRRLDSHVSLHAKTHSLIYTCSICSRSYGTLATFSRHKHTKRDKELDMVLNLLPTPIDVSTKANEKNDAFLGSNSSANIVKCHTCERLFHTKNQLNLHHKIYITHKQFVCPKCMVKKFPTEWRLQRHLLSHIKQRNFKCVYCEKTYKSRDHCRQHMQVHLKTLLKVAQEEPDLPSEFKPRECRVVVQQKQHEASQTSSSPSLQQIPKFIELQMLPKYRKHKNISVTTLSSDITFTSVNTCSFCQRQFKKPNDLQRHLRTHTKERPYNCNQCEKSFALQSTLKEHFLTHAEQRIAYDCQVCGKSYASKKVLVLHLRIHTGERPFKCQHCEQTFRTSGHRKAHIKSAHKQQYVIES